MTVNKQNHTPGPWSTDCSGKILDSTGIEIGQMYSGSDARFVAVAPEEQDRLRALNAQLLEALKEVQWTETNICVVCSGNSLHWHKPDCKIAALIDEAEKELNG